MLTAHAFQSAIRMQRLDIEASSSCSFRSTRVKVGVDDLSQRPCVVDI